MFRNLLALAVLLGVCGIGSGQGYSSSCGQPVPSHLRVVAIPDLALTGNFFDPGPPQNGFLVDLLDAFQLVTGLTYTITSRNDLNFRNPTDGNWSGTLLGELQADRADLAGPTLSIIELREASFDFLMPLMQYRLEILFNKKFGITKDTQYISNDNADLVFLSNSQNATLQAIYQNIQAGRPGSIVGNGDDGIAKILTGNFAFIAETPFTDQVVKAHPDTIGKVQERLGALYISLAVQQGSQLREKLNLALLHLAETGKLLGIIDKYGLLPVSSSC